MIAIPPQVKQNALSIKEYHDDNAHTVAIGHDLVIGGQEIVLMLGPCSVENYDQVWLAAEAIAAVGGRIIRGGAFKPRTSPHSFQGLGLKGLEILRTVADEFDLYVITEALGVEHVSLVADYADIIQIGSRNMQHYPLLWAVGELNKPVMLKRGLMATVNEWQLAAEHIASRGNQNIIMCERGIRSFDNATRNVLDTGAISLLKQTCKFPVIGDPSHAVGRSDLVIQSARAALAAGADGLIVEIHPQPSQALSDGYQSLSLNQVDDLISEVGAIATAMGRTISSYL